MLRRSFTHLALAAFLAGAAITPAAAGCCGCEFSCAPAPLTIWGTVPSYGVNQGPVYSGPGYTTLPTYEEEVSTIGYPYVGYESYPGYRGYPTYLPSTGWPHQGYRRHWPAQSYPVEPPYRHGFYRHGPRVMTVARHWMRPHRPYRDWQDR
jgi:hypothetical protein